MKLYRLEEIEHKHLVEGVRFYFPHSLVQKKRVFGGVESQFSDGA